MPRSMHQQNAYKIITDFLNLASKWNSLLYNEGALNW